MYRLKEKDEWSDAALQRISDTAFIPFDEANKDYQEYLTWVAEGNTAAKWNGE